MNKSNLVLLIVLLAIATLAKSNESMQSQEINYEVLAEIYELEQSIPIKDEFETTLEYKSRLENYNEKSFSPYKSKLFKFTQPLPFKKYDADVNKWSFFLFSEYTSEYRLINHEKLSYVTNAIFPEVIQVTMDRHKAKKINESIVAEYTFKLSPSMDESIFISEEALVIDLVKINILNDNEIIYEISGNPIPIIHSPSKSDEEKKAIALIGKTIERFVLIDERTMKNKSCDLNIYLTLSGFVTNVTKISGDDLVCRAAIKGIYKAGRLPVPDDPELRESFRVIKIKYAPLFN